MKLYWQDSDSPKKIVKALQENEVLITTTDTIPGFLANITQQGFVNLNNIKTGRLDDKPYIILISDISKLNHFVEIKELSAEINKIITKCWPGPLTLVFKASHNLPYFLKSKNGTIAIRCPNHDGLLTVLQNFNGLFSTSANISGLEAPISISEISPDIALNVNFLVDDMENHFQSKSSTMLDLSSFNLDIKIYVLRQGSFDITKIEEICDIKIFRRDL